MHSLVPPGHLPLNFDRMFASSLFILFISASLLLPETKRTDIRIQCFGQPPGTLTFFPSNYAV